MVHAGIDIGGQGGQIVLIDEHGAPITDVTTVPTGDRNLTEVWGEFGDALKGMKRSFGKIDTLGIAVTGVLEGNVLTRCTQLPHWLKHDLGGIGKGIIRKRVVCNDALGAAQSVVNIARETQRNVLYISLGSGMGGSLVMPDGTVDPLEPGQSFDPLGEAGTVERYTGSKGIIYLLRKALREYGITHLRGMSVKDMEGILFSDNSQFPKHTYTPGNVPADSREIWLRNTFVAGCREVQALLARRIATIISTLAPTHQAYTVVLGGGIASGDARFIVEPVDKLIQASIKRMRGKHPFYNQKNGTLNVIGSPHGKHTGVIGAALYGMRYAS